MKSPSCQVAAKRPTRRSELTRARSRLVGHVSKTDQAQTETVGVISPKPVSDNPLGNPCAKGDNHSSVALRDHELISFQCHLDTLRYVEDPVFRSCRISR